MNIEELTYGELKEIAALMSCKDARKETPFKVGEKYIIRCVTYHDVGRVKEIKGDFLILEDASWVADSGRWEEALKTGELSEVEIFPNEVYVNIGSIVDSAPWNHDLPTESK